MKKFFLLSLIVLFILSVWSCKTAGSVTETSAGARLKPADATEEAYQSVYDRYKHGLILDGADKYTVKRGDTLAAISRSVYSGNGFYYPVILLASDDVVLVDIAKVEESRNRKPTADGIRELSGSL